MMGSKVKIQVCRVGAMLLAFLVCMAGNSEAKAPGLTPAVQRTVYEAQQAMKQEHYKEARQILEVFLRDSPQRDHYLVEFTLGNALLLSGMESESISHFRKATELYPGYGPAWQNLGKAYFDLKQYEKAGDCFWKALEVNKKKDPDLLYNVAVCYLMAGKERKALPHLESLARGMAGRPRTEWLRAYLKTCLDLKQKKKAFQTVRRLIDRNGSDPRWWKILGNFYLEGGNYKKALACLTIYSYLSPLKRREILLLGDLSYSIGLPLRAAKYYQKALDQQEDIATYRKLANAYIAGHNHSEAIKVLARALKFKSSFKMWSIMGDLYYQQEDFEKAYHAYRQSVRLNPRNGRCLLMIGYCALHMDKNDAARRAFIKTARFPENQRKVRQVLKEIDLASNKAGTR
ncbi:MAG: tetratricopeptide repeat protein [Deltaproteobacteria bacterium]|nr:tetratricopeptide repeat protein [Deltaproteobacteria bacterium]